MRNRSLGLNACAYAAITLQDPWSHIRNVDALAEPPRPR